MTITLLGAAGGEVTGSCYLVETPSARVLVDCGLFQGGKKSEVRNRTRVVAGRKPDAVLLTHAHLDHVGRLPMLEAGGFAGPVYATPATAELTALILRDSARIQQADAERHNRKRQRAGLAPQQPLYTPAAAEAVIAKIAHVPYATPVEVAPGLRATWAESGHMLGSASIQLVAECDGATRRVVFSGDLGPKSAPILRDFEPFSQADVVFLESTYGGRNHRSFADTVAEFESIVHQAVADGGKIIIPTFAVGRAQLLTLLLARMFREGKTAPFPVFLDSPMAIEASAIYLRHAELFDDEMRAFIADRPLAEDLKTLKPTVSADGSRAINDFAGPCLIMAGAGMCNAGRILHHLKAHLWKPATRVVIVGYQAEGSLGRQLVDGAKHVKIHGERIAVKAAVHTLGGFSAHAGQADLLAWFDVVAKARPRVALTHGENAQRELLAAILRDRYGVHPALPALGETISCAVGG